MVSAQKDEVDDLGTMVKQLQAKIDAESNSLKDVEDKRAKDIAFVEQAFYTSNEEGMGVSPNTYEGQNRMPRPGRNRTPSRDIIKLIDPIEELAGSSKVTTAAKNIMPEQRIVKKAAQRDKDDDKYEYYTSDDEMGRRVQKRRLREKETKNLRKQSTKVVKAKKQGQS